MESAWSESGGRRWREIELPDSIQLSPLISTGPFLPTILESKILQRLVKKNTSKSINLNIEARSYKTV